MIKTPQKFPVGIDLGTTESVLAYVDQQGHVSAWKPDNGSALHASAVGIGTDILVGDDAVKSTGAKVIECFKRDMGKSHCQTMFQDLKIPPEVLSGFVLEFLRDRAESTLGQIEDVVISVPAYFDAKRRRATQEAGRLAGLNVVAIINEPTAAAIGYSFQKGLLKTKGEGQNLLVYDFGGGTFDVTLLRFEDGYFRTLATDGDVRLGGQDLDEKLVDYLAQQFISDYKVDPRKSIKGRQELFAVANQTKHALTESDEHVATVSYHVKRKNVVVTREIFNELIEPFIERTIATCEDVLYEASNLKWQDLDTILLVGGTSQIPLVSEKLHRLSNIEATSVGNPQELVALGCALYAANLSDQHALKFDIANVNSHSLGIRGRDVESGQPMNRVLVPRNTSLPTSVKKKFVTYKDGQRSVKLILLEGESENPDLCYEVGKFRVELGPNVAKGEIVEVFCNYNKDGTIHVSAKSTRNRSSASLEIQSSNTSLESLDVWRNRLLSGALSNISASDSFFAEADPINEHSVGGFQELEELDQLYFAVGQRSIDQALPPELINQQRFARDLSAEVSKMNRLVSKLGDEIKGIRDANERAELERIFDDLKSIENLKRRALNQVSVSLGRACHQTASLRQNDESLNSKIKELESKVLAIWN